MKITRIVSGGQTGADMGGLFAALALDIPTGGYAPKNWMTETGPYPDLMKFFGLKETLILGYEHRTELNVYHSDATILFGDLNSPGSRMTSRLIQKFQKPNLHFDVVKGKVVMIQARREMLEWLEKHQVEVLNIAGNRESLNPGIQQCVMEFLIDVLG